MIHIHLSYISYDEASVLDESVNQSLLPQNEAWAFEDSSTMFVKWL